MCVPNVCIAKSCAQGKRGVGVNLTERGRPDPIKSASLMPWKPLPKVTPEALADLRREHSGDVRLLVDEMPARKS